MGLTEFVFLSSSDVLDKFVWYLNSDKIRTYDGEYYATVCTLNCKGELVNLWSEGELRVCEETHSTLEMLKNSDPVIRWKRALIYASKKVDECILFELSRLTGKDKDSAFLIDPLKGKTFAEKAQILETAVREAGNKNIEAWIIHQAIDLVNALENMSGAFCNLDADTAYAITSYALDHVTPESLDATLLFVEIHR
jgi:hypothetical protein